MSFEKINHIPVFTCESGGVMYIRQLRPLHLRTCRMESDVSWIIEGTKHPFYRFVGIAHDMELEDLEETKTLISAYLQESVCSAEDAEKLVVSILAVYWAIYMKRIARRNPEDRNFHTLLLHAARICCQYNLEEPKYLEFIFAQRLSQLANPREWFEFLSPVGSLIDVKESILYPFEPVKNGSSHSCDSWMTDQHLEAVEYYLRFARNVPVMALCQAHNVHIGVLQHCNMGGWKNSEPYQFNITLDYINLPICTRIDGYQNMTPLTWACQQAYPRAVKLLLRYGATPIHLFDNFKRPHCNTVQPLYVLGNHLNATVHNYMKIRRKIKDRKLKFWEKFDFHRTTSMVKCLWYILRAEPYLPLQFKGKFNNSPDLRKHVQQSYFKGICLDVRLKRVLPSKLTGRVPTLEAIARNTIRKVLKSKRLLPEGIAALPIPRILKEYVDLERD